MINVTRTTLELFGLKIHWYGVLMAAAMGVGALLAMRREKRLGLPKDTTLDLILWMLPAAVVGARIYYVIFSWSDYAAGPWWRVFAVWEGGLAMYGGLIGGVIAVFCVGWKKGLSPFKLLDLVAPSIVLGQAIGRWGNFLNQEAHGDLVTNSGLQFFPVSVNIGGEWYYATFFYESVWCLLVAIALFRYGWRLARNGETFLAYLFLYALERGVVEGLRTDSLMLGDMRVSQGLSLLISAVAAIYFAVQWRTAPKALRIGMIACALIALPLTYFGFQWGILAAALGTLGCTLAAWPGLHSNESPEILPE